MSAHINVSLSLTALLLFFFLFSIPSTDAQGFRERGRRDRTRPRLAPGTSVFDKLNDTIRCNNRFRTFDGTCTNRRFKLAGAAGTAAFAYRSRLSSALPTGTDLASPRFISNVLCSQTSSVPSARRLSEFVTFFGQFLDHTFVASTSDGTTFNIPVASTDPVFANFSSGFFPFTRNQRIEPIPQGRGRRRVMGVERPVNLLPSALDLVSVYGPNDQRIRFLRAGFDGLLLTSQGDNLPLNTEGVSNSPDTSANFFLAGDHRANEHPVLCAIHTLFVREHNYLARELKRAFPNYDDDTLFFEARRINIHQFQKIVYEEFIPMILGSQLPPSNGYDRNVLPSISVEFSTAAFRVGHTMVGNEVSRRGPGMSYIDPLPMSRAFFPRAKEVASQGIETFLRGSIATLSQEIDIQVTDMLRNFLFTAVNLNDGVDLIAFNLQRGRDHALPTYNQLRRRFLGARARRFSDITSNVALQNRLQTAYGRVNRVEAWIGLVAEDHVPGGSVGPTMKALWEAEFGRLRDGDRFFYTNVRRLFRNRMRRRLPQIVADLETGSNLMRKILLRNTAITEQELRPSVWLA